MYIPCAREKVRVAGRPEVFFVLTVYSHASYADVIPLSGVAYIERQVPFTLLEPYDGGRKHAGARVRQNEGVRADKR